MASSEARRTECSREGTPERLRVLRKPQRSTGFYHRARQQSITGAGGGGAQPPTQSAAGCRQGAGGTELQRKLMADMLCSARRRPESSRLLASFSTGSITDRA